MSIDIGTDLRGIFKSDWNDHVIMFEGQRLLGIFNLDSGQGDREGPFVRAADDDVIRLGIDHGSILTFEGRPYRVVGKWPNGLGYVRLILENV